MVEEIFKLNKSLNYIQDDFSFIPLSACCNDNQLFKTVIDKRNKCFFTRIGLKFRPKYSYMYTYNKDDVVYKVIYFIIRRDNICDFYKFEVNQRESELCNCIITQISKDEYNNCKINSEYDIINTLDEYIILDLNTTEYKLDIEYNNMNIYIDYIKLANKNSLYKYIISWNNRMLGARSIDILKELDNDINLEQLEYIHRMTIDRNILYKYIVDNCIHNRTYLEFCYSYPSLRKFINELLALYLIDDVVLKYISIPIEKPKVDKKFFINNKDLFSEELINKLK